MGVGVRAASDDTLPTGGERLMEAAEHRVLEDRSPRADSELVNP